MNSTWQLHRFNWVPITGAHEVVLLAGCCLLLLALSCGATLLTRFPGFVPRKPRFLAAFKFMGWLAYIAPWLTIACAVVLLINPFRGSVLVLSSRARQSDAPIWTKEWTNSARQWETNFSAGTDFLDAGILVSQICDRLVREFPGKRWSISSAEDRKLLADAVLNALRDQPECSIPAPSSSSHQFQSKLPNWLVESVEVTVLKGVMESRNVGAILVQGTDRQTRLGPVWDTFHPTLTRSLSYRYPLPFEARKVKSEGVTRILEILNVQQVNSTTVDLRLLLRVSPRGTGEASSRVLSFAVNGSPPAQWTGSIPAAVGAFYIDSEVNVRLNGTGAIFDQTHAVLKLTSADNVVPDETSFNPPEWSPVRRSPAGILQVGIVNSAGIDSARFQQAWTQALNAMRTDAVLEEWRNEARQRGWKLELLDSIRSSFSEGDVTLEQLPDGLLIRPGREKSLEARISMFPKSTAVQTPLRGRRSASEPPGYYSFGELPLPAPLLPAAQSFSLDSLGAFEVLKDTIRSRLMGTPLQSHLLTRGATRKDFEQRQMILRLPGAGSNSTTATFIFALQDTNRLVPWNSTEAVAAANNVDYTRAGVFWQMALQAVDLAARPLQKDFSPAELAEKDAHPVILLNSSDMSAIQAAASLKPVAFLSICLAAWCGLSAISAPKRRDGEPPQN